MNRPTFYRGAASSAKAAEGAGEWQGELGRRRTTTSRGESSSLGPWGAFIEARSIATIGWYFESFFARMPRQEVKAYKWFRWWSQSTPNDQQFLYSEFAGRREERRRRRRRRRSRHAPSTGLECGD